MIKLLKESASYLVVVVEKVGQDVNQSRGEELGLADMAHLQDVFVLA